jgi:hypothetical protein
MQTNDLLKKLRAADEVEQTMNPSSKLYGQAADHIESLLDEITNLESDVSYWANKVDDNDY